MPGRPKCGKGWNRVTERRSVLERVTRETSIAVELTLDGAGRAEVSTGLPFFDHLLEQLVRHGLFDLRLRGEGDLQVDAHHLVEDTGLLLGAALRVALGDRAGINRYGSALLPMDDALCQVAIDISGRPFLAWTGEWPTGRPGGIEGEVWPEFFRALAQEGRLTLHLGLLAGQNAHHAYETAFKAVGRALSAAVALNPRVEGIPSTKGVLG